MRRLLAWVVWLVVGAGGAVADDMDASWLERERLLGEDWPTDVRGVDWSMALTSEVWGNVAGGIERGAVYTGLVEGGVEVDLGEVAGWEGVRVGTSWLWLSGRDVSGEMAGNFLTVSNIAGFQTLRMFELWWGWEAGAWDVKVGQVSIDADFSVVEYGGLFVNSGFGWPAFISMNVPGGGVAYPVGGLGGRLAWNPVGWFTLLTAVVEGAVYDQNVNRHGFRWDLDDGGGVTVMGEGQVRWSAGGGGGLPGHVKLGGWMQTGSGADALAEATGSGNGGGYVIVEQMVSRGVGELGWFGRFGVTPPGRNVVGFGFDTGLSWKGFLPGRDEDTAGVGIVYAGLTGGARDGLAADGVDPAGAEMVIEATYQAVVTPWLTVQPDVQFVLQPGGDAGLGNALVIGCRASVEF